MWISARTALTLAAAALLLVVVAVAAPLLPRSHLPPLPGERPSSHAVHHPIPMATKFGAATSAIDGPERVRSQRMEPNASVPAGAAQWAGRVGTGAAIEPSPEAIARLRSLLMDPRTVADPRAERAEPAYVVRFVRDEHRVDVMVDPSHGRLVVARDGAAVGGFTVAGLHREFASLTDRLGTERP